MTLERGLQLLRCFTAQDRALSNAELARRTGFSRPTVSRFTYTLVRLGYLRQDHDGARYRLGYAVLSLVHPLLASLALRHAARPLMDDFAQSIHGAVSMGIRDRLDIVYVETSRRQFASDARGVLPADIGLSHPIIATAIGRAWLAMVSAAEREAVFNEARIKTPQVWSQCHEDAAKAVADFRRLGYCAMRKHPFPRHFAVGVPLGQLFDGERIVFNCSVPLHFVPDRRAAEGLANGLMALVDRVRASVALSY